MTIDNSGPRLIASRIRAIRDQLASIDAELSGLTQTAAVINVGQVIGMARDELGFCLSDARYMPAFEREFPRQDVTS